MTVDVPSVDPERTTATTSDGRSRRALSGEPSLGDLGPLLVAFGALLLCVVYVPQMVAAPITARLPIVVVGAAPGIVALVELLRRRDRAASWLAALLAWALVAALLSTAPALSILPRFGGDNGWLLLAASGCWWASGRRLGATGEHAVIVALTIGVVANVALALAQALSDGMGTELLDFTYGRSMGFFGNPVYLGGFLAGGLALIATATQRSTRSAWWVGAVLVAVAAAGINLSGSRVALVGGVAVTTVGLLVGGRRRMGVVLGAVALGVLLSSTMIPESGSARVTGGDASGGLAPRVETWKAGGEAARERPVFGWGPGRWMEATAPRTTLRQATTEEAESVYDNAHNVLVEQVVTTGVVGLVLLLGFVWAATRNASGPGLWFAAGVAITWLLEPNHIGSTPLAFLALGVAARPDPLGTRADRDPGRDLAPTGSRRASVAVLVLAVVALAATVPYVAADRALRRSIDAADLRTELAERQTASRWLPFDPELSDHVAIGHARLALLEQDEASGPAALRQADRTRDLDPADFLWQARHAQYDGTWGPGTEAERLARADAGLRRALDLQPWSPITLESLYRNAEQRGDAADQARWRDRLCAIDACPTPTPAPTPSADGDEGSPGGG